MFNNKDFEVEVSANLIALLDYNTLLENKLIKIEERLSNMQTTLEELTTTLQDKPNDELISDEYKNLIKLKNKNQDN